VLRVCDVIGVNVCASHDELMTPLAALALVVYCSCHTVRLWPSLNMKSAAEFVVHATPWSAELAFMPPPYVPAVFTRQYAMVPEAPPVAESTSAYFVPAANAYPVGN
jgi:hypothetical protein